MFLLKRYGVIFMLSSFIFIKISAEHENQIVAPIDQPQQISSEINSEHSKDSKYKKYAFYLFGFLNGFYLPLSYALALGVDAFDLSNPVFKEKLEPFAKGATLGIGFWFAYKIVEWYFQMAVLKALNATLQNPIISKMVVQHSAALQQGTTSN